MPLLTCIFLLFLRYWEKGPNAARHPNPGRRATSALRSLTEQMHLHKYVQRNLADEMRKRKVHADENVASECERPSSAAITPIRAAENPTLPARRPVSAARPARWFRLPT